MQDPVWQTSEFLQSSCLKHSGVAVTVMSSIIYVYNITLTALTLYIEQKQNALPSLYRFNQLPFTQSSEVPTTNPSGHTQATVRIGKLSSTTHVCAPVQGFLTIQGF